METMVFAVVIPWFWGAIAIIIVAAWRIRRHGPDDASKHPPAIELLVPFVFPVAILVWAASLSASLQGVAAGWYWQEVGMFALLLLQVVTILRLLLRHRARLNVALAISALAVCWAVSAIFTGGMAIFNDWL